ncbi:50S ribosomal protein L3 N(5)-glutamine methyltransferase [Agaribacterium haliotis]|uniref:50S ribosomal protein L3 N(5)-glutamine methyltransferase n=1 Tax=Agaribacterium haliotis TaxID=2013869 RepID=UPI000BB5492C|nr:50S ribosomal protein L3 N(5)-glutamine methyltransferase [Agaribacterium haliotis]
MQLFSELLSLRDWVRWASTRFRDAELFYGHGTDNDWDEAQVLALWAINQPWQRLEQLWDVRLSSDEKDKLVKAVEKRIIKRCPAAYITGEAWFAGLPFYVNENTLVPRSPIAELIDAQFQPWLSDYPARILDLCTGSGCIGIACAVEFADSEVDLVDISADALHVAKRNIERFDLSSRVQAIESDGLTEVLEQRYDLIVSNPPYVSEAEYAQLPAEYLAEPKLGLTSGNDGFDFVQGLLRQAEQCLLPGGLLVVEVGYGWELFAERYAEYPFFWPEFEHGGCGVFILSREQLVDVHSRLGGQ